MATDKEKLTALLDEWGVPYQQVKEPGDDKIQIVVGNGYAQPEHPKVSGYTGFYTEWLFDPRGSFIRMGAWE